MAQPLVTRRQFLRTGLAVTGSLFVLPNLFSFFRPQDTIVPMEDIPVTGPDTEELASRADT